MWNFQENYCAAICGFFKVRKCRDFSELQCNTINDKTHRILLSMLICLHNMPLPCIPMSHLQCQYARLDPCAFSRSTAALNIDLILDYYYHIIQLIHSPIALHSLIHASLDDWDIVLASILFNLKKVSFKDLITQQLWRLMIMI